MTITTMRDTLTTAERPDRSTQETLGTPADICCPQPEDPDQTNQPTQNA